MPKDNDELTWIDLALGFISGAAIGYLIAKALSSGREEYECPNCHNIFEGKLNKCPRCHSLFRW